MTKKDRIREGFVAHTFHLPRELDDELRLEAVTSAIREHISKVKVGTDKK